MTSSAMVMVCIVMPKANNTTTMIATGGISYSVNIDTVGCRICWMPADQARIIATTAAMV
jgi:hypothetical protein